MKKVWLVVNPSCTVLLAVAVIAEAQQPRKSRG